MSRKAPDSLTLDAMVQGDAVVPEEWTDLIASPDGAAAWQEAVGRRARLDRLALLALEHPRMGRVLSQVRRCAARATGQVQAILEPDPLAVTLSGASTARSVGLGWGTVEIEQVPAGAAIYLRGAGSPGRAFAWTEETTRPLPEQAWTLEAGEAPVLLLIAADAAEDEDLSSVLARGGAITALVILETVERETEG